MPAVRPALGGVVVRDWEGEFAVAYVPASNSTHLIAAAAAQLVRSAMALGALEVVNSDAEAMIGPLVDAGLLRRSPS